MAANTQATYSSLLERFVKQNTVQRSALSPRLILIMMANTHDPLLAECCVKDVKAVRKAFMDICRQAKLGYVEIEISGDNYNRDNLWEVIDKINPAEDITVFYYSGHGYSYKGDGRRKYPQLDMRVHSNQINFNKMDFIEKNTDNLVVIMTLLRMRGGRINIAIADCCNTSVPFRRPRNSDKEMNVATGVLPSKIKSLPKKFFIDENNAISILVSSSSHDQSAVSDQSIGSIFTHYFVQALASAVSKESLEGKYLPWHRILKKTSAQAFKESQSYAVDGKRGKQQAIFEIFLDDQTKPL